MTTLLLLLVSCTISLANAKQALRLRRTVSEETGEHQLLSSDTGRIVNLEERTLDHNGLTRYFLEYQRENFVQDSSALVILLHGGTEHMRQVFARHRTGSRRWLSLSDTNGFLLLAPNSTGQGRRGFLGQGGTFVDTKGTNQMWNDLREDFGPNDIDDVSFLAALAEWAIEERQVDPSKVYVTGASNGGMMTQRLILERPEIFAAGASLIANLPVSSLPSPVAPRPMFMMNGDKDPLVPWQGVFA